MRGREWWQVECECGHSRGYHINDGTGGCGGVPESGRAVVCGDRCTEFRQRPRAVDKLYGPAPVGRPQEFIGKKCRHVKVPEVVLFCTGVFSFAEDGNLMCKVEYDGPMNEKTGRRPKLTALHYAGNLELVEDDELEEASGG